MPPAPSWIEKVNYVVDYWQNPCNAPFIVYLELARAPAGEALLTWFSFGADDVIRGAFRPSKALGGNRRGRRGKTKGKVTRFNRGVSGLAEFWRKTPGLGEDVGGWIGKNLPGAHEIKGRQIHQLTKFLWILDDIAQRALFALMIADVTVDFLYEWALLLNESEFCKRDKAGGFYATGPGTSVGSIFICNSANANNLVYLNGQCTWNVLGGSVGPGNWSLCSAMAMRNNGPAPAGHFQQASITDALGGRIVNTSQQTVPGESDFSSVATWSIVGPGFFNIGHCGQGALSMSCTKQDVTAWGGP